MNYASDPAVITRSILTDFPEASEAEVRALVDEHRPSSFMDTKSVRLVLCERYGDKLPLPENADLDRDYL